MKKQLLPLLALAVFCALAISAMLSQQGVQGAPLIWASSGCLLLVFPYFTLMSESTMAALESRLANLSALVIPVYFAVAYAMMTVPSGTFHLSHLGVLMVYVGVPLMLVAAVKHWQHWAFILMVVALGCIWVPVNFGLLGDVWHIRGVADSTAILTIVAVDIALIVFGAYYGVVGIGYELEFGKKQFQSATNGAALYLLVVIPSLLWLNGASLHINWNLWQWVASALLVLFGTAIPEELIFRGLLQNILAQKFRSQFPP